MGEIIKMGGYTRLPIDPDNVLEHAIGKLDFVMVLGIDKDGYDYFAGSCGSPEKIANALYLMERFKFKLMNGDFEE